MYSNSLKFLALLGAVSLVFSQSLDARARVQAAPHCWTVPQISAAQVNELGVMLNVLSLRCRADYPDLLDQYDRFTNASRAPMTKAIRIVKAHFGGNLSRYDNYAISVANKYGAGVSGQSCADVVALFRSALSNSATLPGLTQAANQTNIDPLIAGGACPLHPKAVFVVQTKRRHK